MRWGLEMYYGIGRDIDVGGAVHMFYQAASGADKEVAQRAHRCAVEAKEVEIRKTGESDHNVKFCIETVLVSPEHFTEWRGAPLSRICSLDTVWESNLRALEAVLAETHPDYLRGDWEQDKDRSEEHNDMIRCFAGLMNANDPSKVYTPASMDAIDDTLVLNYYTVCVWPALCAAKFVGSVGHVGSVAEEEDTTCSSRTRPPPAQGEPPHAALSLGRGLAGRNHHRVWLLPRPEPEGGVV